MRVVLLILATVSTALASDKSDEEKTWDVNSPPGEASV